MAGGGPTSGSYSPLTGFIFIFNLIVGAGALTIPHAFAQVGLLYGALALGLLALTSYVTATFMIEAIAGVNALRKRSRELETGSTPSTREERSEDESEDVTEDSNRDENLTTEFMPLMVPTQDDDRLEKKLRIRSPELGFDFDLTRKMELAQMAHTLFSHNGILAFYTCVVVYLYGDLAIYAVAVPKSLREIVCPRPHPEAVVWECSDGLNSSDLYRLFVILFGVTLGPFTFGHVHKTRTLQLITTVIRHASFTLMIVLAVIGIARGEGRSAEEVIAYEKPTNIATFFGVCIYSFMCHHSIPGLVAPITNKAKVGKVIAWAFLAVLSVYLILCVSATFRFKPDEIDDVYTLNFKKYPIRAVAYFLSLFPVCTLSANFPLICITLRENLHTLAKNIGSETDEQREARHARMSSTRAFFVRNLYALLALVPPLVVAFFTEDVSMLVGFTGAYAGLGIQWVVPACLVYCLRRQLEQERSRSPTDLKTHATNPFASPFVHMGWLYLIMALSGFAVVLITITHGLH
ncbi:hypothetical protein Poli38472_000458 [Pythium oligandrum]|uniref:Amino acid transporter transmembrane domain-containing protein n=1 Tax=Pythium oligandrum TaxID=41045 RepID=A0A8K1CCI6_PYTOL|nr:hypothetical protein Poli38472_000458 [Pythium oligandrum]|eukprot:TMW60416.1 hypothetical protein Poli38472_000458 [Pythium oligandrum]